jgi:hypothetical protein
MIICSQLPSNLFLRKLGVVHWLAFLVVSWGLVQLSMGFVPTWGYLCLTRALLGAFEVRESRAIPDFFLNCSGSQAGFFPAMVYIITTW